MNIVFRASAGTGKTHQITRLYTALVLGEAFEARDADGRSRPVLAGPRAPVPPARILLMTFTENAAAELRLRVTQRLLQARQEAEDRGRAEAAESARRALRGLPGAPICTIHAFCAGLLREQALDAGLSPSFAILDEEDASRLLDEAARETLFTRLRAGSPDFDPDFADFCSSARVLGGARAPGVVEAALGLLRQAAGLGVSLAGAETRLPPPEPTASPGEPQAVFEALRQLQAERGKPLPAKALAVFQGLEKTLKKFPRFGKNHPDFSKPWKTAEPAEFADALAALGPLSFTGGGGLNELSKRLQAWVAIARADALYERRAPAVRAFARYASALERAAAARKQRLQVLDFDDLLLRARDVLAARPDRAGLFDVLLLDEAQDTSRLQCDLIRLLWTPTGNSLALCGDVKQSIYAWRNADPRVMPDLEALMEQAPDLHRAPLRESYRSKDVLLDFINRLFARVYGADYRPEDRLVPVASRGALVAARGEGPCVEWMAGDAGDDTDRAARVRSEMEAVARRIRLLTDGGPDDAPRFRFSDETDTFEPVRDGHRFRYADVLILLRRTTHQPALEHALRRYRVPYRVGGRGQGLHARPEAKDLLLLLQVLTRPRETIPLLGFLRSPWVGLSDETLMRLGWDGKEFSETLFHRRVLGEAPPEDPLPDGEAELLDVARALLREYRPQTDHRGGVDLIREIAARAGYETILAGAFRGGQRLANFARLLDGLERRERQAGLLAAELCAELEAHVREPPDVPEAELLDPDQNAVTLMTVHGAKGLTARVVFVPEMDARPSGGEPWAFLAGDLLHVRTETIDRRLVRTPGLEAARQAGKAVRAAEDRNVLYVALTRARDLVILSGHEAEAPAGTWGAHVQALVQAEEPGLDALLRRRSFADIEAAARTRGIAPETAGAGGGGNLSPALLFETAARVLPHPIRFPLILRRPATMLSSYAFDPAGWTAAGAPEAGPEEREDDDRAAFGTAGHEALEHMAAENWIADPAAVLSAGPEAVGLSAEEREDLVARLGRAAARMAETTRQADWIQTEWPFALRLEHEGVVVIVDGAVDLLFEREGTVHLLDYKFTDEPPGQLAARYGLQLNIYREAAARRFGRPAGAIVAGVLAIGRAGLREIEIPPEPGFAARAVRAAVALHGEEDRPARAELTSAAEP